MSAIDPRRAEFLDRCSHRQDTCAHSQAQRLERCIQCVIDEAMESVSLARVEAALTKDLYLECGSGSMKAFVAALDARLNDMTEWDEPIIADWRAKIVAAIKRASEPTPEGR